MFDTVDIIIAVVLYLGVAVFAKWHFKMSFVKFITLPVAWIIYLFLICLIIVLAVVIAIIALPIGFVQLSLKEWGLYDGENILTECSINPWNTKCPWFKSKPKVEA